MTDKRLEEILKQSFAQEVEGRDIFQYKKARERKIMKIRKNIGVGAAAAVLIVVAGVGTIGAVNPALAAKIPLIGGIFAQTEDSLTFSGNYTENATVLDDAEGEDTYQYTADDQDFAITASEIYSDGYSVYLTLLVESDREDLSFIPEYYIQTSASDQGEQTAAKIYSRIEWNLEGSQQMQGKDQLRFIEGKVMDEHTFAGMIKIDLPDCYKEDGTLELKISGIGYDDIRPEMQDQNTESAAHWYDGNWNLLIPVQADLNVRMISIDEEYGNYTLKNVMVSDYQVVVDTQIPVLPDLSQEELMTLIEEHPEITDNNDLYDHFGIPQVICDTYVFDQDGELLTPVSEENGLARFAVQGKELSELHIYIFDNRDDGIELYKGRMDESEASRAALISKDIILE